MSAIRVVSHLFRAWLWVAGVAAYGCATPTPGIHHPAFHGSVKRIALLGDRTFPEGIAAHRFTGDIFVGGLAKGAIQRVRGSEVSMFKQSHADGLANVIGLAVDASRDRLWVCSTTFDNPLGPAALFVFDTNSSELLAELPIPADGSPHFLNDIDVDSSGNAYATDSLAPQIWTVPADLSQIDVLVRDPAFEIDPHGFNLNGVAVAPGDRYLIASVPSLRDTGKGRLFRIDIPARRVLEIEQDRASAGADGLTVLGDRDLIASGAAPGLHRLQFDAQYSAVHVTPLERFEREFSQPTTAAVANGRLWVVNSQLDHFVVAVFGDKGPPALPFEIAGIPIGEL